MEPLPTGANFLRCKLLWEIGLHIAGDPETPYYGNRDMCIAIGKGSGDSFKPWLRMATGAPHLALSVARGELDVGVVNPSAMLTQAYRGTGLFSEALPVRVVANYPSWDRFVFLMHPRTGLTSLGQIKEKRYPLRLSTREDRAHSTRVLIEQTFALYGFSLKDLESWGGSLQINKGPGDARRMQALRSGTVDAVFDEGLALWFDEALAADMRPVTRESRACSHGPWTRSCNGSTGRDQRPGQLQVNTAATPGGAPIQFMMVPASMLSASAPATDIPIARITLGSNTSCSRFSIQPNSVPNTLEKRISGCTMVTGAIAMARYMNICEMQTVNPIQKNQTRFGRAMFAASRRATGRRRINATASVAAP
jgi:hypothetical protein